MLGAGCRTEDVMVVAGRVGELLVAGDWAVNGQRWPLKGRTNGGFGGVGLETAEKEREGGLILFWVFGIYGLICVIYLGLI